MAEIADRYKVTSRTRRDEVGSGRKAQFLAEDPDRLARAVARLSTESREHYYAQKRQAREIESLRGEMRSAQAAIRGLGDEQRKAAYTPDDDH